MKPLQMTLLAAIVSATLFSCSKIADKVSGGAISSGKCEIKASVSGSVSGSYESVLLSSMCSKSPALISLSTTTTSLPIKTFMIMLPGDVKVGTYNNLMANDQSWAFSYTHNTSDVGQTEATLYVTPLENKAPNFTVTVTKITSEEIEGTFSGTMTNPKTGTKTITISNGSFKGKF